MTSVLQWNAIALEALRLDFTDLTAAKRPEQGGPTLSSRAMALVHMAMHDAYFGAQGFPGGNVPYLTGLAAAVPPTDPDQALATAAYEVLCSLYKRQHPRFNQALSSHNPYGAKVAGLVLAENFAVEPNQCTPPSRPDRYFHQLDPLNPDQGMLGSCYGQGKTFTTYAVLPELDKPPVPGMPAYTDDAKEVLVKGAHAGYEGLTRTPDETMAGQFWAYDGANEIGTPPRLYNQVVLAVMAKKGTTNAADQMRLLALVNIAMGDAGILAWREKYRYFFWRPVIGIRQHDTSTGPAAIPGGVNGAIADPFWLPLGAPRTNTDNGRFTPDFPAYPSGHATFGAAALQMVRLFYGQTDLRKADNIEFDFISEEQNGQSTEKGEVRTRHVRHFDSCWRAIYENGASRVFLGVHWRFDAFESNSYNQFKNGNGINNIGGVPLGLTIAEHIYNARF